MRPLRLSMTAFGPYAGTEVVDFEALTGLGLFVVAGNNGAGKTTIFDALHYALYGTLPGRRASYIRLKSDHACDRVECSVTLDFVAHGQHWRVERSPKQKRAKRRGAGTTEAPAAATIFRIDNGSPIALTNRADEVRAKCGELVGLSGKQFERVALLPQGQFSRVLTESSTERRELLRTLFSSEIFDNATTLLTDAAGQASAAEAAVTERLEHRQAALADELAKLINKPVDASTASISAALASYRNTEIAAQRATLAELQTAAESATQDHRTGLDVVQRHERRQRVNRDIESHRQAADQHQADVARLAHARAAVPVTSNARSFAQHEQHHAQANQRVDDLQSKLDHALVTAGLGELHDLDQAVLQAAAVRIDDLDAQISARREASARHDDVAAQVARSHAELRRLANHSKQLRDQGELAATKLRQATTELNELQTAPTIDECEQGLRQAQAELTERIRLAELEDAHGQLVRRATEIDTTIERLVDALDTAAQAQASHAAAQAKADSAFADYRECERRRAAANEYQAANDELLAARASLAKTQSQANTLWDAFIAGTAARVAQTLSDDQACPVCGSCEHPAPAEPADGGLVVTEAQVANAREERDRCATRVQAVEARIEALRATDADISSLSTNELDAQVTTTKAMALGARTVADETHQAAALYPEIDAELTAARAARAEIESELRTTDQSRSRTEGSLGAAANEPVATLRERAKSAAAQRAAAEHVCERREDLQTIIESSRTASEESHVEQITISSRRAAIEDQLAEQQTDLDRALADRERADAALASMIGADSVAGDELEIRARAARHARQLVAETITAVALAHDAASAVRRAQSILDERLQQSPFTSLDQAMAAFVEPLVIDQLEAQTTAHIATGQRLQGQLTELADVPEQAPDIAELEQRAHHAQRQAEIANTELITTTAALDRIQAEVQAIESERAQRSGSDLETRRLERVAALAKGDNDRNTSLENWVLAAHLRDVVELANIRLARSTHQRFQLCVMDDGENKRGRWGLDLGVEDTVTGTRRPTPGLSGGELFQASLALALGLADAVMNQTSGVQVDALFIDEGFGSLDETSVERAIDLLDELRDRGAMVGVITHVPALLDALPLGVEVVEATNGQGSTIKQQDRAA